MLREMLQAFVQYKKLTAVLVAAVVLMIFGWIMAARSARRRSSERDAVLAKLRQENELRSRFAGLTAEKALQADGQALVHALALQIQSELEKEPNIDAAYINLPAEKQYIYALNFLLCEDAETISRFFRLNGAPLTDAALAGARAMFDAEHLSLMEKAYKMFDSNDETVSALPQDIQALDAAFGENTDALFDSIRQYIAEHSQIFVYHLEG